MEWLHAQSILVMKWPSLSPDLNPVENIWGQVARRVYRNGKQYSSVPELSEAVYEAWGQISENNLLDLCDSMKNRVYNVIRNPGKKCGY